MSPPFDRFLRPSYLHHFLGEKPPTAFSSLIPMIKHDTFYCGGVNDFMRSPQAMYETHAPVMDRMENMFKPLYPFVTVRKSHGWIVIAKREGAVKLGEWQTRQEALQAFLAIIGADAVSAIMGSRNDDAQAVLAGTRAFRLSSSIEASTIASLSASGSVVLPSEAEPVCSYLPTPIAFGRDEREAGQVNDIRLKSLSMLMLRPSLLIICCKSSIMHCIAVGVSYSFRPRGL